MIKMFDRDGTRHISFQEFVELHNYLGKMRQAFDFLDKDRSGTLSSDEISQAVIQAGYNITRRTLNILFKKFDFQNKGSLQFDGYVQLCLFLGTTRNVFTRTEQLQRQSSVPGQPGTIMLDFDAFADLASQI